MEKYMLPCLTKKFFGIECPGCGGQRALVLFLKGNFTEAFFMYPAIYPIILLALLMLGKHFIKIKFYSKIVSALSLISVMTILISYGLKHFI